jgi:hypothetical protein
MPERPALDALDALRQSCLALGAMPLTLAVCPRCTATLLDELAGLFAPLPPGQAPLTLAGACIMGFTFTEGPDETCMLHRALAEEPAHG